MHRFISLSAFIIGIFITVHLMAFTAQAATKEEGLLLKIEQEQAKADSDTNVIAALYNELSVVFQYKATDRAIEYANKSIEYAAKQGNISIHMDATANLAAANCYSGEYIEAKAIALAGLAKAQELGHSSGEVLMWEALGRCAKGINDYQEALVYYNNALDKLLLTKSDNEDLLIIVYGNMAGLYVQLERMDTAIEYYDKVKALVVGDNHRTMVALVNLAFAQIKMKNLALGEQYAQELLKLAQKAESKQFSGYAYHMLGDRFFAEYESTKDEVALSSAENYFHLTMVTLGAFDKNTLYSTAALNYARVLLLQKKFDESLKYLHENLEIARKVNLKESIVSSHYYLAENYIQLQDYEKATFHLAQYKALSESAYKDNLSQKVSAKMVQFETKSKERDLAHAKLQNESLKKDAKITFYLEVIVGLIALAIIAVLIVIGAARKKQTQLLEQLSSTDSLTGLYNRRAIEDIMDQEILRDDGGGVVFSIVMADIDKFKEFNDNYGHACGDEVLKAIAKILKNSIGSGDAVARWGGEEFIILLAGTKLSQAQEATEKLRQLIEDTIVSYKGKDLNVTLSFGVAQYDTSIKISKCINLADDALYQAKSEGRNRVVTSPALIKFSN